MSKFHNKENFDCGNSLLNNFLKKYAYQNQNRYLIGVTYVIHIKSQIIGYITLSASSIKKVNIQANKPYENIPVLRIARLAVDKSYQKKGIGKRLLKFAINKAIELQRKLWMHGNSG